MTEPTAGITLSATTAIRDGQQTFTREQVEYLLALTYETGRLHAAAADMAEVVACWDEFAEPRMSREQRVAARLAEMDAGMERERRRPRNRANAAIYEAIDDWPEVAVPGSVDLTTVQSEWLCPCPRTRDGRHVMPKPDQPARLTAVNGGRAELTERRRGHLALVADPNGGAA